MRLSRVPMRPMLSNVYQLRQAAKSCRCGPLHQILSERPRRRLGAAGSASLLFLLDFPLDKSAAVAKHFTRLVALHIPQAAAAAGAGLVPEDDFAGLFGLAHRGSLWSSALSKSCATTRSLGA